MTRPIFGDPNLLAQMHPERNTVDVRIGIEVEHEPAKTCKVCGEELDWVECWECGGEGEGDEFHDCGEDTCCCLHPEPGRCPECHGEGGWLECPNAEHHAKKE